jgi:hypothetical protein
VEGLAAPDGIGLASTTFEEGSTVMKSFLFGAVVGAAAMYYYGRDIKRYVDETTRDVRAKAAGTLVNVAETIEGGLQEAADRLDDVKRSAQRGSAA